MSKTQKMKECRRILKETNKVVSRNNVDFLMENIFPLHKEWRKKYGVGIDHIEVRPALYATKCFYLVRTDGTETDISYMECLYPKTKMDDIKSACRTVVSDIVDNMKKSIKLPFTCPITGEVITDRNKIQIDHYDLTFDELVNLWLIDKNIDELYEDVNKSNCDNSCKTSFSDGLLAMDFYDFHNKHTHLRAVSKKANLSVLTRKNIK